MMIKNGKIHHKGGGYRKWYGNIEYVINWENNGQELRKLKSASIQGEALL